LGKPGATSYVAQFASRRDSSCVVSRENGAEWPEVTNPTQSGLVRAAMASNYDPDAPLPVSYWRFDLAVAADPHLAHVFMEGAPFSILPHRILANPSLLDPANGDELVIALGMQRQVADFFASRPLTVTPPFFEVPTLSTLPETRNFTWPFEVAP